MTVFSKLLPIAASAYGLQALFAAIFVPLQNTDHFDLSGAVGWLSTTFISLYYPTLKAKFLEGSAVPFPPLSSLAPRQVLLSAGLFLWSLRLSTLLVSRAIKSGGDPRFDEAKTRPGMFIFFWVAQATWIMAVGLPVYLVNTLPPSLSPALGPRDYLAVGLYAISLVFETVADEQKSAWRRAKDNKEHDEKFITSGLWSVSRHPNYLGEMGVWTGIWVLASASLQSPYFPKGTIGLAAVSPLFTWFLLTKLVGVPALEQAGDKKFGNDPKWQEYKRTVPKIWPWGSRS